jgi:LPXTG-motif cell wall-anchored protein
MAAGSTTTTSSQITPTAPSRLTTTGDATTTTPQHGPLPNTGYDLLPETVLGLALVGAGVVLRVRRTRT